MHGARFRGQSTRAPDLKKTGRQKTGRQKTGGQRMGMQRTGMQEPWFWHDEGRVARSVTASLMPIAGLYDVLQRVQQKTTQAYHSALPVICIGNATLGGVGKTPCAMALAALLDPGLGPVVFLSRGYGGTTVGPIEVRYSDHSAADVGDEPLLLAAHHRVVIARNRAAGAQFIETLLPKAGAIMMDDGFQNPAIRKDVSILLVPPRRAFGNNRGFPAGPMREPLARAMARADIIIQIIDPDTPLAMDEAIMDLSAYDRPVFRASLAYTGAPLAGKYHAFCGIGRPLRFFTMLEENGADLTGAIAFPNHHAFTDREIERLIADARTHGARLITTAKDAARLSDAQRQMTDIFPVEMIFDRPGDLRDRCMSILREKTT